jgi:hypothetical protein
MRSEFAAELRWIDPLDDLAFPVMDLLANSRRTSASLLNGYLESGDYDGVLAVRASSWSAGRWSGAGGPLRNADDDATAAATTPHSAT